MLCACIWTHAKKTSGSALSKRAPRPPRAVCRLDRLLPPAASVRATSRPRMVVVFRLGFKMHRPEPPHLLKESGAFFLYTLVLPARRRWAMMGMVHTQTHTTHRRQKADMCRDKKGRLLFQTVDQNDDDRNRSTGTASSPPFLTKRRGAPLLPPPITARESEETREKAAACARARGGKKHSHNNGARAPSSSSEREGERAAAFVTTHGGRAVVERLFRPRGRTSGRTTRRCWRWGRPGAS